jgi:riboflavin kinase/FMN adenylyltransferase
VHRGHQAVLRRVVEHARARRERAVAMTFDPHPLTLLSPQGAPGLIMPVWRRCARMDEIGIDAVLVQAFDEDLKRLGPREFVQDVLREGLGARMVVVGEGFRFGAGRAGDAASLGRGDFGPMDVETVAPLAWEGAPVSSSRIRAALTAGDVALANALLGQPYELIGTVVRGDGRGRTIGVPTANLRVENGTLPADGVYAAMTAEHGLAVVNIGVRPTFGAGRSVEAHLLDFDGNLYDRTLGLAILGRLRGEMRFSGVDELKAQIARDIEAARAVAGGA